MNTMKRLLSAAIPVIAALALVPAAAQEVNYDESKVGPYTLEDPLTFVSGKKVKNKKDWTRRRELSLKSPRKGLPLPDWRPGDRSRCGSGKTRPDLR